MTRLTNPIIIAVLSISIALGLVWYIFNQGKTSCENNVKSAQLDNSVNVIQNTNDVRKQEQRLKTPELDKALCELGIARGNKGCD